MDEFLMVCRLFHCWGKREWLVNSSLAVQTGEWLVKLYFDTSGWLMKSSIDAKDIGPFAKSFLEAETRGWKAEFSIEDETRGLMVESSLELKTRKRLVESSFQAKKIGG